MQVSLLLRRIDVDRTRCAQGQGLSTAKDDRGSCPHVMIFFLFPTFAFLFSARCPCPHMKSCRALPPQYFLVPSCICSCSGVVLSLTCEKGPYFATPLRTANITLTVKKKEKKIRELAFPIAYKLCILGPHFVFWQRLHRTGTW